MTEAVALPPVPRRRELSAGEMMKVLGDPQAAIAAEEKFRKRLDAWTEDAQRLIREFGAAQTARLDERERALGLREAALATDRAAVDGKIARLAELHKNLVGE